MQRGSSKLLFFALLTLLSGQVVAKPKSTEARPCPSVVITRPLDPSLTPAELRWICGDPDSEAYKDIPLYQAAFHLRAFLDRRGYIRSEFQIKDGILTVDPGNPVKVSEISLNPPDAKLLSIANRYNGHVIRPSLLNAIESSVQRELLESGYSCAVVGSQALDSKVSVTVNRGPQQNFSNWRVDPIEGLLPEALIRFRPFHENDVYDIRLIELHEKRLLRDNVVQGTYFRESCKNPPSLIEQSFLLGPPRTLRFGVGIDTESGPLLQVSWRHHRFSRMASQAAFTVQASLSQQSVVGRTELYPWPGQARTALTPQLKLTRSVTEDVVEITNSVELSPSRTWDFSGAKWSLSLGPAFITNWFQTAATDVLRRESSLALIGNAEFRSHDFEIFDVHPQAGSLVSLSGEHRDPTLGFFNRSTKIGLDARHIRSLGFCAKGRCIGAVRSSVSSTWTSSRDLEALPPSLKSYLGGFDSLRGFGLKTIPNNEGVGALSSATAGIELRGLDVFVPKWEPYVFYDVGAVGYSAASLEGPLYSAYGLGLRWSSPIGMIQGYIARPSIGSFYFYASFGGEF